MKVQTSTDANIVSYSKLPDKAQVSNHSLANTKNASMDGSKIAFPGNHSALQELLEQRAQIEAQVTQMDVDYEMDGVEQSLANRREGYQTQKLSHEGQVRHLKELQEEVKEANGITAGSEAEKDLSVLLKVSRGKSLTTEERERLRNYGELKDYERVIIDYDKMSQIFEQRAETCQANAMNASLSMQAIRIDRLKSSPMLEAKREVEALLTSIDEQIRMQLMKEQIPEEDQKGLLVDEKI